MAADATIAVGYRIEGRWRLKAAGVLLRVTPRPARARLLRWAVDRLTVTVLADGAEVASVPFASRGGLVVL